MVLILVGCGGKVVHLPKDEDPSGVAGAKSESGGAHGAGRPGVMDPGERDPAQPSGATAGAASGGASTSGGAPAGGATNDPEPEAGTGGVEDPAPEPMRTVIHLPSKPRGFVYGVQYEPASTNAISSLQADFETSRGTRDGCTQVKLDQCSYYDCPPGSQPYRVIGGSTLKNAGDLSATASGLQQAPIQLVPLTDYYYEADVNGSLWPFDGGTMKVVATGAAVPAFALELPTPPTVTLTSINGAPVPTVNTDSDDNPLPTEITRSHGIQLRWTSHGTGTATFILLGFEAERFLATCEFDAAADRGELPATLLQELEPGTSYHLAFRGTTEVHATVGDWEIEASLSAVGGPMSPYVRWPVTLR